MRKPPAGELCAGDPHVRFGGERVKSRLTLSVCRPVVLSSADLPVGSGCGVGNIDSLFVCFLYIGDEKTDIFCDRWEANNDARNGGAGFSATDGSVRGALWL